MKHDAPRLALPLGLLGLNTAISLGFLLGGKLPDPAPAGFWLDGSVLSEAAPWVVAFRLPLLMAVLLVSIGVALTWDARVAAEPRRRKGAWGPITNVVMGVGCIANLNFLTAASEGAFILTPWHLVPTGILLFALGNYVAKSASNGFWGLHNRWTRTHESVGRRTNRLLGIMWMVEGLGLVLASPVIVSVARSASPDGWVLALSLLPGLLLAVFPLAVAALASYGYAKQAPAPAKGD